MFSTLVARTRLTPLFGNPLLVHSRYASSATRKLKAVGYSSNGEPGEVLKFVSGPPLSSPKDGQVKIEFLLSNVNPADVGLLLPSLHLWKGQK